MATLLDGKAVSASIQSEIRERVTAAFTPETAPRLCVILVGDNPSSASYVRTKCKMAEKLGFRHEIYHFDENVTSAEVEAQIDACNADPMCDAVFVQLPLPKHLDSVALPNRVRADKDADGLTRAAMGALLLGESNAFQPCTPRGIIRLLDAYNIDLTGLNAVVIGRSNIVGKPMSLMLQRRNATVTMCHTRTRNLEEHVRRADLLVVAAGVPELVKGDWIKPGAIVVDAGFTKTPDGVIHGDVDFAPASERASFITPVPGGVGPMTVISLMEQTLESALKHRTK
ncbi:MAG: bifunctional 5,10-methylenetetrahydrofolate dehydrogenase/5,10-methenyltetrahydrofolate cyclohydrolase [Proteobacteria bacterium]|nr:bifunctional 5,10-methylenetetrahydrofolate dehydrogenase/5,10-methenyltetrahydrofolate cyclohydrolase [Pseudomonadota bacterium]